MNGIVEHNTLQGEALQIGLLSLGAVFLIILILVAVFTIVPRIRGYVKNAGTASKGNPKGKINNSNIPAGDSAAIAAAIFLFLDEIHDNENRVITIKRANRVYSPWNSKIYGVNWMNNRKF